jgi:predicted TIM-barrel fold metal-dependent hydrolase
MIIDFHTHAFPAALAAKTIPMLAEKSGATPFTDGTAEDLSARLRENGIDLGVVLPVVTRPGQFDTVNAFARTLCEMEGLISFGGIHPDDETPEEHVRQIREMGLRGVKIHPDYQGVYIDDPRYIRIAREAVRLGLILITHAGVDDGFPEETHCPPNRAARFVEAVYRDNEGAPGKIVFAHGGGNRQFAEVIRCLAGLDVYFDLSYILSYASPATVMEVIRAHGSERILFGTDYPWGDPGAFVRFVRALPLTENEREDIFHRNAERLLFGRDKISTL